MNKVIQTVENAVDYWEYKISYPLVTATVTNKATGIKAKGHALCDPTDEFEEGFGANLAHIRALNRVTKKLEKHYIKSKELTVHENGSKA